MGSKVKEQVEESLVRILVVSQIYRDYKNFGEIDENVNCLKRIYAENVDIHGEDFKKKFEIVHFFDKDRNFQQLKIFIASGDYDLIHFSLHGDEGVIIFSNTEQIPYSKFETIFSLKHNIKAVILNICESAGMTRIIARNTDWVLGWNQKVILKDATEAADTFYTSFFAGNSIEDSFMCVASNESINPLIYQDSKLYIPDDEPEPEENHDGEDEIRQIDNEKNKITRRKKLVFTLTSIGLVLVLLIVPVNKILNPGTTNKITVDADSLQITFPSSGSRVERNE
ncbi:MAG TPA: hypothetical protein DDW27_07225, partial [Bacteroidales bacterium]|nr:hypothetical protein [Bacteroidales bacterium]